MAGKKELLDDRWFNVDLDECVSKLNQFYTDTRFHEFYQQHQMFYQEIIRKYEANVMQYFHKYWYARFYGEEPYENYLIIIGFTCGPQNYGAERQIPGMVKESFSICGYWIHPQTDNTPPSTITTPKSPRSWASISTPSRSASTRR